MARKILKKNYRELLKNLEQSLQHKNTGFVEKFEIGEALFDCSIPPVIEIVLLDPLTMVLAFRRRSNPQAVLEKTGDWQLGRPADVADSIETWLQQMIEVKAEDEEIEIYEQQNKEVGI